MRLVLFALSLLFTCSVFSGPGGWVSSGGEVFQFAKNPWFVKNTTDVKYCVEFSASEFSADKKTVLSLVKESFDYWKSEFSGNMLAKPANPISDLVIELGQQNFLFNDYCQGNEEIIFKFGYQTLSEEEILYLEKPEKFLGVTIRKEYFQLKGTGVVFISGDIGEHSYVTSSPQTVTQAWRYPKLLKYVILHEIGHIFGVPHTGSGLMSEVFLDQLLIKKIAALYVREPIMPFIQPVLNAEICDKSIFPEGSQDFIAEYFKLDTSTDCIKLQISESKKDFEIFSKKKIETESFWKKIGVVNINFSEISDFSLKPAVMLQLPADQNIYENFGVPFKIGPIFQNFKTDGHMTLGSSMKPYPLQIDLSSDSLVLFGIHNNKVRQVFKFGNPLLYSLFSPF
jgi:hypothetical protein